VQQLVRDTARVVDETAKPAASADAIRSAALLAFLEHGFHGTSVRDIAAGANISVAGLYHHFSSKADILFDLMSRTMDDLVGQTERALADAGRDPAVQLRAIVQTHVLFHTERRAESFVGNSELRSLGEARSRAIIEKRDRQQRLFDEVVEKGVRTGLFATPYPLDTSRALVTMCTAVATWYREHGPLSPSEISQRYADLALAMVESSAS
jgi:AcrR family transcriptional regulator